jgi:hypothetical protein
MGQALYFDAEQSMDWDLIGWDRDFYKGATRQAMQIGETVESIRLAGMLMALEALRKEPMVDGAKILAAGRGTSGALAL